MDTFQYEASVLVLQQSILNILTKIDQAITNGC